MKNINSEYVRDSYDTLIAKLGKGDYKDYRWFKDEVAFQQYKQTKATIMEVSKINAYQDVLEIGCGPGTWTELLSEKSDNLIAVDISKEMIKQASNNVKNTNVTFLVGDFLDTSILLEDKFDVIHSIRAFEYFSNKEQAIRRAHDLLTTGGTIFIITKNPRYLPKAVIDSLVRINIIGSNSNWLPKRFRDLVKTYSDKLHSDWIRAGRLRRIMEREGFRGIRIYPAVIGLGYSGRIWKIFTSIHSKLYKRPLSPILTPLVESYLIVGTK